MTKYLNAKHGIEIETEGITVQLLVGTGDPSVNGNNASVGSIYLRGDYPGGTYLKYGESNLDWALQVSSDTLVSVSGTLQAQIDSLTMTSGISGTSTFIELTDTPESYSSASGKYPRVSEDSQSIYFDYIHIDVSSPQAPLIPETAVSGTYFVNFEAGRLLIGATGNKPDLVYLGPIGGLAFADKAEESCYGSFKIPYSWNTNSDIKMRINFMNDIAQVGTKVCSWKLDFHTYSPGDFYFSKTTSTADFTFTFPSDCVEGMFHTHDLILPYNDIDNPLSRGDIITFRFYRDGISLTDTLVGDAVLLTLMMEAQVGQHILGGG